MHSNKSLVKPNNSVVANKLFFHYSRSDLESRHIFQGTLLANHQVLNDEKAVKIQQ